MSVALAMMPVAGNPAAAAQIPTMAGVPTAAHRHSSVVAMRTSEQFTLSKLTAGGTTVASVDASDASAGAVREPAAVVAEPRSRSRRARPKEMLIKVGISAVLRAAWLPFPIVFLPRLHNHRCPRAGTWCGRHCPQSCTISLHAPPPAPRLCHLFAPDPGNVAAAITQTAHLIRAVVLVSLSLPILCS